MRSCFFLFFSDILSIVFIGFVSQFLGEIPRVLVFFSQKSNGSYVRRIVEAGLGLWDHGVFDVFATEDLWRFTKTSEFGDFLMLDMLLV